MQDDCVKILLVQTILHSRTIQDKETHEKTKSTKTDPTCNFFSRA